ncbi:hypothetical protein L9F63_008255, partial [Diploptera punctata]
MSQSRGPRCQETSPASESNSNSDCGGKCQLSSKENVLGTASERGCFSNNFTHTSTLGPTLDDALNDAISSTAIKGDEYWRKLKTSLTHFKNLRKCITKNDSERSNKINQEKSQCCCKSVPKKCQPTNVTLTPRLYGCVCGPETKCQLERRKGQECICRPIQKYTKRCICGSNIKNAEANCQIDENNSDNVINNEIREKICQTCIIETCGPRIASILGPTLDDSLISCIDFFMGRGKDSCRKELEKEIKSSQSKLKVIDDSICKGADEDYISWLQNEYSELSQDVMKAKGQNCSRVLLENKILEERKRTLNSITEALGTKRELEQLGTSYNLQMDYLGVDGGCSNPPLRKRMCPGAKNAIPACKSMETVRTVGKSCCCGGFDTKLNDHVTSDLCNQFRHITNLEAKRGSVPFSPMPSLKEVRSGTNNNTIRKGQRRCCCTCSSSEDSDECPDECACTPVRHSCSVECQANCAYPFPGEDCVEDCIGKCNCALDAKESRSIQDAEGSIAEEFLREDVPLQKASRFDDLMDMGSREKSTTTEVPDLKEKVTSVSNLITKSSKVTQTLDVSRRDATTSISPSKEFLLKTSELEPMKPSYDGDSCLPTCIKYRTPICVPNCIKYTGLPPRVNPDAPGGMYPLCQRYSGGIPASVNVPTPNMMTGGIYPQGPISSFPQGTGYGNVIAQGGVTYPDQLRNTGIYPRGTTQTAAGGIPGGTTQTAAGGIRGGTIHTAAGVYPRGTTQTAAGGIPGGTTQTATGGIRGGTTQTAAGGIRGTGGMSSPDLPTYGEKYPQDPRYGSDGRLVYPKGAIPTNGGTLPYQINRRDYPKLPNFVGGQKIKKYADGKTTGDGGGSRRRIIICNPNRIYGKRSENCRNLNCPRANLSNRILPPVKEKPVSRKICGSEFCGLHHKSETTDGEDCGCSKGRQTHSTKRTRPMKNIKNPSSVPVIGSQGTGQHRWFTGMFSKSSINTKITKVLWAVTRINIFQDESKTYEVMAGTEQPPVDIPRNSE